ncbi:MAG TPA: choice-of-anchor D domain-containing protein [Acidisarcina sp.]|nr:choice-of-anchor D domain-containing protein [Acidisarcina sp.]
MRTIMTVTLACNLIAAMCGCGFQLNGLPSNAIRVSPGSLTFGNVPVGRAVTSQLDVTNVSAETVVIADVSAGGQPFSVSSPAATPISIPAFGSHTFKIGFRPDKSMRYSGQLTLKDTSAKPIAEIPIAGAGTSDAVPQLAISASSLNFGSVIVNSVSTQAVTLTSTGTAPVTISGVSVTGTGFTVTGTTFPMTLNPSEPVTLQVQFQPTVAGTASGQLIVGSNSSTGGMATVALSGTGTAVSPSPQTSPQLSLSASSLNFGSVIVNSVSTQAVTLTSTGTAPVTISSATLAGTGFTTSGLSLPVTLDPNLAVTLQIQFNPTAGGAAAGQLLIQSNSSSGSTVVVALSGTGVAALNPQLSVSASNLDFGSVPLNSVSTQSITLTSTGTSPVTISSAIPAGAGFTLSGASFPLMLDPGQATTLWAQFTPTTMGTATGQLTISSNSLSSSTIVVAFSGNGTSGSSQHVVDLRWNAPKGSLAQLAGYNIYRSSYGDSFQLLNQAPNLQTTYVDSTIESGVAYSYIVKSVDLSGMESDPTNEATVIVP